MSSVAFCPCGKYILSGSYDKTVRLWDVASGEQAHALAGHACFVSGVAFSPGGGLVASSNSTGPPDFKGVIKLWDLRTGREVRTFR